MARSGHENQSARGDAQRHSDRTQHRNLLGSAGLAVTEFQGELPFDLTLQPLRNHTEEQCPFTPPA